MNILTQTGKNIQFFEEMTKVLKSDNAEFDKINIITFIYYNCLEIIEKFDYDFNKLYRCITKINNTNIANGNVYRIYEKGDLQEEGYEKGYLFLTEGSSILEHIHTKEKEHYRYILGDINCISKKYCNIDESHRITSVNTDTIVRTYKYIPETIKR